MYICITINQITGGNGQQRRKVMTSQEIFAAKQILTVEIAKSLIGKRIQTVYSGYRGQDGDDTFVIGQVVSELEYYRNLKEECYQNHKYAQFLHKYPHVHEHRPAKLAHSPLHFRQ